MQSNYSLVVTPRGSLQVLYAALTNASAAARSPAPCPLTSSRYQFSLIPALFSVVLALGLVGNSVVVVVLCRHSGPKTVANIYILNLAVADLLCLATLPFWATYYAQGYNWLFGSLMCKISSSVLCLNMFASIFFITCMSVDRYHAIVHPMHSQRRTLQKAYFTALVVWGLACLSSLPTFYFRDTHSIESLGVNACIMAFPQESYARWAVATAFLKNALGFFIPLTVITTCYVRIRKPLLRAREFGKNKQKRDKVLKLVAAVVVAFLISWLPFHVLTFLDALAHMSIISSCAVTGLIDTALPFGICMAFANSCINPLLYCFIGNQFQEKLHRLFKRRVYQLNSHRESSSLRKGSCFRDAETPVGREGEPESLL
ncbi:type-2 angiotensin II receptor [Pezoporus wallicus]|uniref:type-2 angiotensin II receptor n=1 Tax=Pezoporus wallicus TaxID=35540 RepID=UPI00254BAE47|nr:type-2 angiotensin II receptor [Pezoporus wallicus]XP_061302239.1 type-2 angiotensin II receptor [Pezoporus flaviventris]